MARARALLFGAVCFEGWSLVVCLVAARLQPLGALFVWMLDWSFGTQRFLCRWMKHVGPVVCLVAQTHVVEKLRRCTDHERFKQLMISMISTVLF